MSEQGLRYNQGKTRYDLLPPYAIDQLARNMTKGADKYAERNWEKGMKWTTVLASLKRHLADWEMGKDYDPEDGQLLMAKVMTNAAFLTEYYKIAPQYDDRPHKYLKPKRIGLDIDEVLADWVGAWCERYNIATPETWHFDRNMEEKFNELRKNKDFWMNIKIKTPPSAIPFEPTCYITHRPIPNEWTEEWLDRNNYPVAPVYTVFKGHKHEVALAEKLDVFVDDSYDNFVELNNAGILCYLFDAPHNRRYDVGFKRIKSLNEI